MRTPRNRIAVTALALSAAGLLGILTREDIRLDAYPDPVHGWAVPTIGAGSIENVKPGDRITPLEAVTRTAREVQVYETALKGCVKVPLTQYEYDAYIELAHNIGARAFCTSTIVQRLNQEDYDAACDAILMWKRAGKQDCSLPGNRVCPGLWRDRLRTHAKCKGLQ
ncbi:MAG TPA: lysozyme [Pseudomonadales bacterium]